MSADYWMEKFRQWQRDGRTMQDIINAGYGFEIAGEYARFRDAPYSGTGDFNYLTVSWSGGGTGVWNPTYNGQPQPAQAPSATPMAYVGTQQSGAPIPAQATAYQGRNGAMPTTLGYAPRPQSNQTQQAQQPKRGGFSDAAWSNLRYGTPFAFNGHTYTDQYNYIGNTMGVANNQAQGWEQLNAYGQPLGTLGPLNNRRTMTMQFFNGSGTNPDKVDIVGPRFNTPGGGIPGSHNTGGIKPVKNNNNGGSNTYNDLINWRI